MWMMLQRGIPDDYIIATGESHSVKDFLELAMKKLDLGDDLSKYVDFDASQKRPSEVDHLIGDASKAKELLGWVPTPSFDRLVEIMVENDLRLETNT